MKKRSRRSLAAPLKMEQLEARLALAGLVTVVAKGDDLTITGDSAPNDVSITLIGNNWHIVGNNGTNVRLTTSGQAGGSVDVPAPAALFRNVSIDLKEADVDANHKNGNETADLLAMEGLGVRGNLTVKGKNGGVVELDGLNVSGKTSITFGNGLSDVQAALGSVVSINASGLGLVPVSSGKGKDLAITTGIHADQVVITDTAIGGNLTISGKDGNNTVALLGTRQDTGGVFDSTTKIDGKATITTGAGNDGVGMLGVVVRKDLKIGTGKGNDFSGAADLAVLGKTSVTSTDGDDIVAIGLEDVNGDPLPPGGLGNSLLDNVTVDTGKGNDLVAAHGTEFGGVVSNKQVGGKITVKLGAGDDKLAETDNDFSIAALDAIKASRGGAGIDSLLSPLDPTPQQLAFLQFEANNGSEQEILDAVFQKVRDSFGDILLDYGIDIGAGGGGGGEDLDDQLDEANALGDVNLSETVAGIINVPTDVDMYSFTVGAGQVVDFFLFPSDGAFDGVLRLFDENGIELANSNNDPGEFLERTLQQSFSQAGTFFVGVSGNPNEDYNALGGQGDIDGATGQYELTVGVVADPDDQISEATDLGPVGALVQVQDAIDAARDVDMYAFSGVAGQVVSLVVTPAGGNVDIFLRLFNGQGSFLDFADADTGGGTERFDLTFAVATTVFVGVSSFPNDSYDAVDGTGDVDGDELGDYTLTIQENDPDDEFDEAINLGAASASPSVFAAIGNTDDRDMFSFTAEADTDIAILVTPQNGQLNVVVTLFDANQSGVAFEDDANQGLAELLEFHIVDAGTYFVEISSFGVGLGSYQLQVAVV